VCPKNSEYSLREATLAREVARLDWWTDFAISPDSRILAVAANAAQLFEVATGKEISRVPEGHRGALRVHALTLSPDGRLLTTGGSDGTILVWDWQQLCHLRGDAGRKRELTALWADLLAGEAPVAYRAIGALTSDPDRAVAFLKQRLRPVGEKDREEVRRLLRDLESKRFGVRQHAEAELA